MRKEEQDDPAQVRNTKYISTDFADAAFFSNLIAGKSIIKVGDPRKSHYDPVKKMIKLSGFELGSSILSVEQEGLVRQVFGGWSEPIKRIRIEGYTDATPFPEDNEVKQAILSDNRAKSIKDYLERLGEIDSAVPIVTEGKGIYPGAAEHDTLSRCVQIYLE